MSEEVDREKVLRTTKVRTTLKSDVSWIHKEKKRADDSKESMEEPNLALRRQTSYVLMTTKKFELSPPPSPSEKAISTNESGMSSDNGLQNGNHSEPVSPEPIAASTATEEKNGVEPLKSNESAESLTNVQVNGVATTEDNNHVTEVPAVEESAVNGCSLDTETPKVMNVPEQESCENGVNTPSIEESVSDVVPDILAESVFKSPPPQENGNGQQAEVANVLDSLSESLVAPLLSIETNESERNPSSETVTAAETLPNANETIEQPVTEQTNEESMPGINNSSGEPPDGVVTTESLITPNEEGIVESGKVSEIVEALKEQEISTVSSDEPQTTTTSEDIKNSGTASTEDSAAESNLETIKTSEETVEEPKASDTSTVSSEEPEATQSTIIESGISSSEVAAVENNVESAIIEDTEEIAEVPELPSTKADTNTIAEDAVAQENVSNEGTAEEPPSKEEEIVDQIVQGSKNEEVLDILSGSLVEPILNIEAKENAGNPSSEVVTVETLPNANAIINNSSDAPPETTENLSAPSEESNVQSGEVSEIVEVLNEQEISTVSSDVSHAEELQDPQTPSTSEDIEELGTASVDVGEVENNLESVNLSTPNEEGSTKSVDDGNVTDELASKVEELVTTEIVEAENTQDSKAGVESVGEVAEEAKVSEVELVMDATAAKESPETSVEASAESPKENGQETTNECPTQVPALPETNQDETYKAEPAVVVSSPESTTSEAEEISNVATEEEKPGDLAEVTEVTEVTEVAVTEIKIEAVQAEAEVESTPVVPAATNENNALFDISDALETAPSIEQSKEDGETDKVTEEMADSTVKESDESKDLKDASQLSVPKSTEEEETSSASLIMRDGREVCSHCDQFIGLIMLTLSYPPMYLHPECLMCGVCTKVLGDLLTPMFEHKQRIYCSDCYDQVYSI